MHAAREETRRCLLNGIGIIKLRFIIITLRKPLADYWKIFFWLEKFCLEFSSDMIPSLNLANLINKNKDNSEIQVFTMTPWEAGAN